MSPKEAGDSAEPSLLPPRVRVRVRVRAGAELWMELRHSSTG